MSIQVFGKDFTDLHFVARAIDLKNKLLPLTQLYVDENNIVGTDGKRLHMIDNPGIEQGMYQIIKRAKTELQIIKVEEDISKYPNFRRLFKESYSTIYFEYDDTYVRYAQVIRTMTKESFNFWFFEDIDPSKFSEFYACDNEAIYFKGDDRIALIMPIRGV